MTLAIIILGGLLVLMLSLFFMQKKEMKSVRVQLMEIRERETNAKIHATGVGMDVMLIQEINTMLEDFRKNQIEFQQRNHEVEQMMTNISHDLRTPLTSALGYIQMIQTSELSEEEKAENLQIVEKRLLRLKELIDAFFEFSKVISKEEKPELSEINMVSVLEEAVAHYYDEYCDRNRAIEFRCEKPRILMQSNKNMAMRIFDNLIINALKHGLGDLSIVVGEKTLEEGKKHLQVDFSNQVLDPDIDVSRLFEEFYTTDISRTKGNTGLGLAIVKQFTKLLGGDITATLSDEILTISVDFMIIK